MFFGNILKTLCTTVLSFAIGDNICSNSAVIVWDASAFASTFIAFNKFSMVLDTEAVPMLLLNGNNIGNMAAMASRRLSLVSNGSGNILPMLAVRALLMASFELTPNNIGNSATMVSRKFCVVLNGNWRIIAVMASARFSSVFTGKFNIFNIVSTVSGRFLLVSNGTGRILLMLAVII